ncbi:MAG TPA: hypothetical protein VN043_10190 [Rhodanobacter sp.]|nr:hypothetical protein [Rhodanobacter sp.]
MSPQSTPARMRPAPVSTGGMALSDGMVAASIITTIITTGTGTTGSGQGFVRN